jgi:hypothetical protein
LLFEHDFFRKPASTFRDHALTRAASAICFYLSLFALDRQATRADVDMDALGLVAVLIELIAQHGDGNRKCADDKIEYVAAGHGGLPLRRDWGMLAAASIRVARNSV